MSQDPLFLDTTIQVDRVLKEEPPAKLAQIEALLAQFGLLLACSFSRLEYKRVVIQNLGLILAYLHEENSFFGAMQRAQQIQQGRRPKTLTNLLAWLGYKVNKTIQVRKGEDLDAKLTMQAKSYLRVAIISL